MAPVCLFVIAIARLMRRTPNRVALDWRRACRASPYSRPPQHLTSTSRKTAKSFTSVPKALRAASLAAKQSAYRNEGRRLLLQHVISSLLNTPSSRAQLPCANSRSTRQFSIRSIPRPTITMTPSLELQVICASRTIELHENMFSCEMPRLVKKNEQHPIKTRIGCQ